ncbi:hypothetical protein C6P40_004360 [Pichia californica]|uniref:DNA-directed RNA polymerase III subunit RPC9 n=1 Tax=Pichia californica TaxID=460514 RepID=A0A9P6WMH4_9ASCO|nr:hypothetical protein C6P40_004360 [[Candida] californica]
MKIIQQREKLMSNFEVYQHLCEVQKDNEWGFTIPQTEKKRKHKFNPQLLDLEIITRDLSQYLTKVDQGNDVKAENFINLMLVLNSYELEIIEKLMIMNVLPRSLVNLYSIIEECEERFTQEQCEELLANVEKYFPAPVEVEEEEEEGEGQEGQDIEMIDSAVVVEDDDDDDAFVQDDELEHEGIIKRKNDDKEIDEVDQS